ncbi:MAG: dTDP-4-amino-4,6-dideoxy-D-glucose transaminase [Phycisphaerae bacterium]|nr:dTDP-4-amino-4,6-dideoxy-D-glucose transaminase [Phycisphaerae bacterium]
MADRPIFVTQPSLAPLDEFTPYLRQIWDSGVMTHNGPLLQRLEAEVSRRLGVKQTVCLGNGTLALQLAIRALDLHGQIITTPFTYAATASSIAWEYCTPVFADIDPDTWNLDPVRIAEAITDQTVGIMPVHVFSAPCDVAAIESLAAERGLKVIYDAAHAMCVQASGRSVMDWGDISCTSFHATKLFNTCEGGACFTRDDRLDARLRQFRFFGHDQAKELSDDGTNAKMTEIHAALGLANLGHLDAVIARRRELYRHYQRSLAGAAGLRFQAFHPDEYNYSYMPVLLPSEKTALAVVDVLAAQGIHPRRYFHPALHKTPAYAKAPRGDLSIAEDIASRILCMPLYHNLPTDQIDRICGLVAGCCRSNS